MGHGAAAGLPEDLESLLAVDMAAVGEGQNSDEFHASLCVKDSGGPYHHGFSTRLRELAEKHAIPYKVDIYPFYGSDGEAWWRAGGECAGGTDRSGGGCLAQLRAHAYRGTAGDDEVGAGVFAGGVSQMAGRNPQHPVSLD